MFKFLFEGADGGGVPDLVGVVAAYYFAGDVVFGEEEAYAVGVGKFSDVGVAEELGGLHCVDVVCGGCGVAQGFYFCAVVDECAAVVEYDFCVAEVAEAGALQGANGGRDAEDGADVFAGAEFRRQGGESYCGFGGGRHGEWLQFGYMISG